MLEQYKENVIEEVKKCKDVDLLDLILKLLINERGEEDEK